MFADEESAFQIRFAGAKTFQRFSVVPPNTVWIYHFALERLPLPLKAFAPSGSRDAMVAGSDRPQSRNGVQNDAGEQKPND